MPNQQLQSYLDEVSQWHKSMEDSLLRDGGWLSLVGLEWLQEGINTIGSAANNDIHLPAPAPAKLGYIEFSNGEAKLSVEANVAVTIDGERIKSALLRDDHNPNGASLVKIETITLSVIKRVNQYAIRIRDSKSPAISSFTGRNWFPIDSAYRVPAKFLPYPEARTLRVINSVGLDVPMKNPGYLEFELHGEQLKLEAFESSETQWWIIFKDGTSGKSSYGAGRFLYVQHQGDDQVWIDFNRAYSPPCAFTHHATCPLAPRENTLTVQVNAGERYQNE